MVDAVAIGLHKDHVHLVKFSNPEDEDYENLSEHIQSMVEEACANIEEKWKLYSM
jgi:hypothetical protein